MSTVKDFFIRKKVTMEEYTLLAQILFYAHDDVSRMNEELGLNYTTEQVNDLSKKLGVHINKN